MTGSTTAIWIMVIVIVVGLVVWLGLVRYAAVHPAQKFRRREQMRGVVQGGQHVGGGRSVMPHRDAPVPEDATAPSVQAPDVEDIEAEEAEREQAAQQGQAARADQAGRGQGTGKSGNPMDL